MALTYPPAVKPAQRRSSAYVAERVGALRGVWAPRMADRTRIRAILNGGIGAVRTLFGESTKYKDSYMPSANFIDSGMSRLAQKLGHLPDTKVDPPLGQDGPRKRYDADMLEQIITCYDTHQRLELQLPQQARWLPGYGFCVWTIDQHRDAFSGHYYPVGRVRDAYDCFPGSWNADQDPEELAIARIVSRKTLEDHYPMYAAWRAARSTSHSGMAQGSHQYSQWGQLPDDSTAVLEFYDITGCYLFEEESGQVFDFWPNPLEVPPFVVARRFTFDQLVGHWDHVIGLQAMLAKMNILAFIATEDATFRETNIIGDPTHSTYKRGRNQFNYFPLGTQITKPQVDANTFQAWQQIDRLERHLRIGGNYPVTSDSESPSSFVTGQGIQRLGVALEESITEYQKAFRYALQRLDSLRLAWDEHLYSGMTKPMYSTSRGQTRNGSYDPARIKGWYNTRRVYGMMAGWDEPQKIVGGLQLLAAGAIDLQTMQENLHGLENISQINERNLRDGSTEVMIQALAARATQGDPAAMMALKKIRNKPQDIDAILDEAFPDQAAMPQQAGFPAPGMEEAMPDVTTILSRLEQGGELGGGSQTVAQI